MKDASECIGRAEALFSMGFHCLQAVLGALSSELGISEQQALKLGGCFGGGMCAGEVCGAVTGGLMALGLRFGQADIEDLESRRRANDVARALLRRFEETNGSYLCRELLHHDLSVPEQREQAIEAGLFRSFCPRMVKTAAQITHALLAGKQPLPGRGQFPAGSGSGARTFRLSSGSSGHVSLKNRSGIVFRRPAVRDVCLPGSERLPGAAAIRRRKCQTIKQSVKS